MASNTGEARQARSPAKAALTEPDALIRLARSGDSGAYGELVERYRERIYNAVYRITGHHEDAKDLTQDAFVQALVSLDSFRGQSSFYTWLFRIAVNLALSHRRRQKRAAGWPDAGSDGRRIDVPAGGDRRPHVAGLKARGPGEQTERDELCAVVWDAMQQIAPEHRAILLLREIEMFDYQQIGQILDLPPGTVRSRLHRARTALRELVAPIFSEEPTRERAGRSTD